MSVILADNPGQSLSVYKVHWGLQAKLVNVIPAERRCDGPIIFVKEENKRLGGPFEVDIYTNLSLIECQAQCLRAEK